MLICALASTAANTSSATVHAAIRPALSEPRQRRVEEPALSEEQRSERTLLGVEGRALSEPQRSERTLLGVEGPALSEPQRSERTPWGVEGFINTSPDR